MEPTMFKPIPIQSLFEITAVALVCKRATKEVSKRKEQLLTHHHTAKTLQVGLPNLSHWINQGVVLRNDTEGRTLNVIDGIGEQCLLIDYRVMSDL